MLQRVTGQVERTPGGDTPYAVFFKLDGVIIGGTAVHDLAAGDEIVRSTLEYLDNIAQEVEDEAYRIALQNLTSELLAAATAERGEQE
jgi:hypothetical protein